MDDFSPATPQNCKKFVKYFYHKVPFSHFGVEVLSTTKWKNKKKNRKKDALNVFVATVLLQSLKFSFSNEVLWNRLFELKGVFLGVWFFRVKKWDQSFEWCQKN